MIRRDEEEHEFSECSEDAIHFLWPDWLTPQHPLFGRYMIELQLALLKCHVPLMAPTTKRRALNTVRELKTQLSFEGNTLQTQV